MNKSTSMGLLWLASSLIALPSAVNAQTDNASLRRFEELLGRMDSGARSFAGGDPRALPGCSSALQLLRDDADRSRREPAERAQAWRTLRECAQAERAAALAPTGPRTDDRRARIEADLALTDAAISTAERGLKVEQASESFRGLALAVGVGLVHYSRDAVSQAEIAADGKVRIVESVTTDPRVILEAHYFGFCRSASCKQGRFGWGPFFGIAANQDTIDSFALGAAFGFREADKDSSAALVIGLGAVLDRKFKTLAPGFEEGRPPPAGETTVRLETRSKWSPMLFVNRAF